MLSRKTLHTARAAFAALACGLLLSAGAGAGGDKKAIPAGVWMLAGGEGKLEFADKDILKIYPHGDPDVITIVCTYKVGKKMRVSAKITQLDGKFADKAKDVIPVGLEFNFTWQAKDDAATLGDMKGEKIERIKSHLEGKYEKK
jgi:hypothetical protein